MAPKRRLGVGAIASVRTKFLHPSAAIRAKFNNAVLDKNHFTHNLIVDRPELRIVNRKEQRCCIMTCNDYVDAEGRPLELYTVIRNIKVITEGDPALFFQPEGPPDPIPVAAPMDADAPPAEIPNFNTESADVELFRGRGIDVDDDNDPLPENVVPPNVVDNNNIFGDWGFSGTCYRKQHHQKTDASLRHFANAPESKLLWF